VPTGSQNNKYRTFALVQTSSKVQAKDKIWNLKCSRERTKKDILHSTVRQKHKKCEVL